MPSISTKKSSQSVAGRRHSDALAVSEHSQQVIVSKTRRNTVRSQGIMKQSIIVYREDHRVYESRVWLVAPLGNMWQAPFEDGDGYM